MAYDPNPSVNPVTPHSFRTLGSVLHFKGLTSKLCSQTRTLSSPMDLSGLGVSHWQHSLSPGGDTQGRGRAGVVSFAQGILGAWCLEHDVDLCYSQHQGIIRNADPQTHSRTTELEPAFYQHPQVLH